MPATRDQTRVLVGPRFLDERICRLVYRSATDEVWAEEWRDGAWVRTRALVRHILKAPVPERARLREIGVPATRGDLDREFSAR